MIHASHKSKLRWRQFSLRTLVVVVAVVAIPLSWLGRKYEVHREKEQLASRINRLGGTVVYDQTAPAWIPRSCREFLIPSVHAVEVWSSDFTNDDLLLLQSFGQLEALYVGDANIDDTGLVYLEKLTSLKVLILFNTHVSVDGIQRLQNDLPDLRISLVPPDYFDN